MNDTSLHNICMSLFGLVYITICVFDFIIMPVYTANSNLKLEKEVISRLESAQDLNTFSQSLLNEKIATHQWEPLTLGGGAIFHLAFGALLTGGAVTTGMAKIRNLQDSTSTEEKKDQQ